jgi:hypothetical protein
MKNANIAVAAMVIASLALPTAHAKPKKAVAPVLSGASSQAGGLPATNERVAALEGAVVALRADLAAVSNQLGATQNTVFVSEGSANNIRNATVTVASKVVPAGTYLMLAAVQMVNGQLTGDANARCVMLANGIMLADTSDLEFPILTTVAGTPGNAFGSTMFAPLQGSYSSTIPITVIVECNESNGKNGGLNAFVQIAAMKVASVQ